MCAEQTSGVFNSAKDIIKRMKEKDAQDAQEKENENEMLEDGNKDEEANDEGVKEC